MAAATALTNRVLVTGGNAGIGFALCKQLVAEDGCFVYLGARNATKGEAAVSSIREQVPGCGIELIIIDTSDDASVDAAAKAVSESLGGEPLYAVVNNAGTGLAHGVTADMMVNTNLFGPKRVTEAFVPMVTPGGRIVNVGSGAGPMFVSGAPTEIQRILVSPDVTWAQIEEVVSSGLDHDGMGGYGVSKAALAAYTMLSARTYSSLLISSCTPGFIATSITEGMGASKSPEEGTVSIRHCLFEQLEGSGWFYGSDALRSPLHFMRNPGEPPYDGTIPLF